ncbi:MAG: T9SS type A sorting domain-containing protein, partial [Elusimicrobia bacterium]|nr:T9SS type A sorting domain-containing protein [Elusimicrobiota bacterium]
RGHDPDDDPSEPRPVALAADGAGELWVADAKGGRVLRYDASLTLQQTVTGFERPAGVAASPSGACLAVSDDIADRLYTFDARKAAGLAEAGTGGGGDHGRGEDGHDDGHGKEPANTAPAGLLASFGVDGEIDARKPLPAQLYVNQVSQLAFTADGTLLAADRNNDLIQGFGLPGAPLIVALGPSQPEHHGGVHLDSVGSGSGAVEAVARVGAAEGGSVQHPDGVQVDIPPAAMSQDQDISVAPADTTGADAQARAAALAASSLSPASPPTQFGPEGLQFAQPASVTLPYDPTEVTASAAEELKVEYWNPTSGAWEPQPSVVDVVAHTVTAQVRHFSLYQVLAPARVFGTLADPEETFSLRSIYVFPNPAVGGDKPTFHVAVGKADSVTIRIYDIAGRPVHSVTIDSPPSVVSDETGTHYAYEYPWDGHIPSGVYIYAVTAEKGGNAPIRRVGKFAVVR